MARKQRKLNERNKFYIFTNGESTEKNYFNLIKKNCGSIYDVTVKFLNDDPCQLVIHAAQIAKDANRIWCVFDIDNTFEEQSLIPAIKEANKLGIKIAFSNKAFEVWLLYHYKRFDKEMTNAELIEEMNKLLKSLNIKRTYDKADKSLLEKYFIPHIQTAMSNAKIVYQTRIRDHNNSKYNSKNYPIWEWNSCTNVFELMEDLRLKNIV